ncbi:hypothetical protein AFLA_000235 [Aspergillus flavus NRRL3357]|nr:hypothetical protein AFLA_000235 [Aspergillus flavus NRRL3357]
MLVVLEGIEGLVRTLTIGDSTVLFSSSKLPTSSERSGGGSSPGFMISSGYSGSGSGCMDGNPASVESSISHRFPGRFSETLSRTRTMSPSGSRV